MQDIGPSKKRVLINSASGAITLLINVVFVFWLYQYLLARVPADEFAIYPVLMVIMMLGPVIISFFASAISRDVIMAYTEGRNKDVTMLHTSAVLALGGFLSLLLLVGVIAATQIEHLINVPPGMLRDTRIMTILVVFELCLTIFGVPFGTAFEVRQKYVRRDMINLAGNFVKIGLTFILLVGLGPRVLWIPVASLTTNLLATSAIIFLARRMLKEFRIVVGDFDITKVRAVLNFGLWTSLGTFAMLIYQSAGPVLLNIFSTPVQVTSFFIGSVFDRRIASLMTVALAPIQPVMIAMSATGDWTRLGNTYLRGGRYALWVSMAVACPMFIYADDFVTLYLGEGYEDTAVVMRLFLAIFPVAYADILLSRVAIATGKVRGFFTGAFVTSLLFMLGLFIVLKEYNLGAIGAAAALSGVNLLSHLFYFWPLGLKLTNTKFSEFVRKVLVRGLAPSVGGALIWVPAQMMGWADSWVGLFACAIAGGALYILTAVLFCLSPDEKQGLHGLWLRIRGSRA